MRAVVLTLAVALLLDVCVWLTTKDSIRPEPGRERVERDVPAVVVPNDGSASVTTHSAPTTVSPDEPAVPTTVPVDKQAGNFSRSTHASTYPPGVLRIRKWLVAQLVAEGLSKPDSQRIERATYNKPANCQKLYGRLPSRRDLYLCNANVIQESGMSEAFRRLWATIRAGNRAPD